MDLIRRPYAGPEDAAAIAAMFNDIEVHIGSEPSYAAPIVRQWMAEVHDVAQDTRLIAATDGTVAGFGWVEPPVPGATPISMHGGIRPAFRGCGLGRELFAWQLERARTIHAATAPDVAWRAYSSTNARDAAAVRLFDHAGWHVDRNFLDMATDLPSVPNKGAAALPDGVVSVPFRPEDAHAIYEAHMQSFAEHYGFQHRTFETWSRRHPDADDFRGDLCRVAFDGKDIAGFVLCHDDVVPDALHVSTVGTRRAWRGRGIASALIAEIMAAACDMGKVRATLGVDATNPTGAVGVYERLGFRTTARWVSYGLELPPVSADTTCV